MTVTRKDPKQGHLESPDMMATLPMSHQHFPAHLSVTGAPFQKYLRDICIPLSAYVTIGCYLLCPLCCLSNSLLIFGRMSHKVLQRRSAKKTEVGDAFDLFVEETEFLTLVRVPTCLIILTLT